MDAPAFETDAHTRPFKDLELTPVHKAVDTDAKYSQCLGGFELLFHLLAALLHGQVATGGKVK